MVRCPRPGRRTNLLRGAIMTERTLSKARPAAIMLLATTALFNASATHAQDIFGPPVYYSAGYDAQDVVAEDLNHDQYVDLAAATREGASILLNNGDGTFGPRQLYPVGLTPRAMAVGLLNNDPHPDLVVSNYGSGDISVLINNGDGTFAASEDYGVGDDPYGLVVRDLNGDAHADVAVVVRSQKVISIWLNNGEGALSFAGSYAAGGGSTWPSWIAAGDFDGDEDVDLAVTKNWSSYIFTAGYVQIFLNDGDAVFTASGTFDNGNSATSPMARDFDGDGDTDIAVSGFVDNSYRVSIFINDGGASFSPPDVFFAGAGGRACAGDLDGDGSLDIAVSEADVYASAVCVVLNDGSGGFESPIPMHVGYQPRGPAAADLDGDSDTDLVVAVSETHEVAIFENQMFAPSGLPGGEEIASAAPLELHQNRPNPFAAETQISYILGESGRVTLAVYDVEGRIVTRLFHGVQAAGRHTASFDGQDLPSGVYFYGLSAGGETRHRRMHLQQ
ncbi:MAG: T9SS type A sorting domain-containing protein [Candidatus Eisenbacteria bacterium]|nr:T9SS type A sorting domain-containing protein [Candidatus Eisenbacteria bacterium]